MQERSAGAAFSAVGLFAQAGCGSQVFAAASGLGRGDALAVAGEAVDSVASLLSVWEVVAPSMRGAMEPPG
jgi:hypothetical protein